jgi:hypothetical protein
VSTPHRGAVQGSDLFVGSPSLDLLEEQGWGKSDPRVHCHIIDIKTLTVSDSELTQKFPWKCGPPQDNILLKQLMSYLFGAEQKQGGEAPALAEIFFRPQDCVLIYDGRVKKAHAEITKNLGKMLKNLQKAASD